MEPEEKRANYTLHISLMWRQRYTISFVDPAKKDDIFFVPSGSSPKRVYCISRGITEAEYDEMVADCVAAPGVFIVGEQAKAAANLFFSALDYELAHIIDTAFEDQQVYSEAAYYGKLNLIIDHIDLELDEGYDE